MSGTRKTACNDHRKNARLKNGFHLIEILIVCSILVILCSFALPLYTDYMRDAKRMAAKVMLLRYAAALERYYFLHQSYKGATAEKLQLPDLLPDKEYSIHLSHLSDTDYVIRAVPKGAQATRDKACATLIVNQMGERAVTGNQSADVCWR